MLVFKCILYSRGDVFHVPLIKAADWTVLSNKYLETTQSLHLKTSPLSVSLSSEVEKSKEQNLVYHLRSVGAAVRFLEDGGANSRESLWTLQMDTCQNNPGETCSSADVWMWFEEHCGFWLSESISVAWNQKVFPKRCTVAEWLHIDDSDNDAAHIGIILPCEVLAPGLLNMHECLKWILEDFHPLSHAPPTPSLLLSDYIIIFLSIKIQMHNLNIWQQQAQKEKVCVQQLTERLLLMSAGC